MGIVNVCHLVNFEIILPLKTLLILVSSIFFGDGGNLFPSMAYKVAIN